MKKRIAALFICITVFFAFAFPSSASGLRIDDGAGLLSDSERQSLSDRLDEVSERLKFDIVIVTTDTLNGKTPKQFADDYYDYYGYSADGALLLISMEDRDWYISTSGMGISALDSDTVSMIGSFLLTYLSSGDYSYAFSYFITLCEQFVTISNVGGYDDGNVDIDIDIDDDYFEDLYDKTTESSEHEPLSFVAIPVCIGIGLVIALIVVAVMWSQLKSVRYQRAADNYVKEGSMNVVESRDTYLYRTVNRVAKPKDNDSHSSSSHRSSHGGGGGKF